MEDVELTIENALTYIGEGVVENADEKLNNLLEDANIKDIRRALLFISDYSGSFEFNRIGRDGGGSQQAVSVEDVGAYQLVLKVSLLYPSAMKRVLGTALKFTVPVGPLLWHVKDIFSQFVSQNVESSSERWGNIGEQRGRELWPHQEDALNEMIEATGRGHFLYLPVGLGKTLLVLSYLKYLQNKNLLPKYVIYTLPASALKSVINEITAFGFEYQVLVPLKHVEEGVKQGCEPDEYKINLIKHDHLRKCEDKMPEYMSESIFIIDEVHKCLNESKRTATALQFSHLSQEFIALTGTPIIDTHTYKLIWWLKQIVPFEVNEKNFWVAANSMISRKVNTGIEVDREDVEVEMTELKEYLKLIPPNMGGKRLSGIDFNGAMNVCYKVTDKAMVDEVINSMDNGVFVVARNAEHQKKLRDDILRKVDAKIFLITGKNSIFLTDEAVENGNVEDYDVVITTIRHSEGYTLTRLGLMITSVYPSNNASREQLEGRINRIGQKRDTVYYRIYHTGILTYILEHHNDARSLSSVLSALAEDF